MDPLNHGFSISLYWSQATHMRRQLAAAIGWA
jgi:hypothetical protein